MSWDINLLDPITMKELTSDVKHELKGGTYCVGGTDELWLNITYNYGEVYCKHDFCIDDLDGKDAADCIPILDRVISELKDDVSDDYWEPTEGNAKRALIDLRALCKIRPDGIVGIS